MIATLLAALSAQAATVGACAVVEDGPVPLAAVQAMTWHALRETHSHDPHLVRCDGPDVVEQLQKARVVTLLQTELTWLPHRIQREGQTFLSQLPWVTITELQVEGGALVSKRHWETVGTNDAAGSPDSPVFYPDLAVQDAIHRLMASAPPPTWRDAPDARQSIPVVIVADEEYRALHGPGWRREVGARIDRASQILDQAGLELQVVGDRDWRSPNGTGELEALLPSLKDVEAPQSALRIGFTAQPQRGARTDSRAEDVGRAWMPGRDVLLVDQLSQPGVSGAWDVADEAVAVAHEVMHALGVPHVDQPWFVMSELKQSTVAIVSPSSRALSRAAAQARWAHWDSVAALEILSQAARDHLAEPEDQLAYIVDNLRTGPGMPHPGQVSPTHLSALGNVAMGHHLIARAAREPSQAEALHQQAMAHSRAAAWQLPDQASALLRKLHAPERSSPPPDDRSCTEEWGPWVVEECAD